MEGLQRKLLSKKCTYINIRKTEGLQRKNVNQRSVYTKK